MKNYVIILICFNLLLTFSLWGQGAMRQKDAAGACIRCDAGWYEMIATKGYSRIEPEEDLGHWHGADVHQTEWAFFPLYPLVIRWFSAIFGVGVPAAMILFGALCSSLLVLITWKFLALFKGPEVAFWGALALPLQPFGIYFHVGMTEGLFMVALVGSFLAIAKRSWMGLAFCSTALVLTRPNGLILLPVLLLYALEVDGPDLRGSLNPDYAVGFVARAVSAMAARFSLRRNSPSYYDERKASGTLAAAAISGRSRTAAAYSGLKRPTYWLKRMAPLPFPLLAFAGYCLFQWQRTGHPFAFSLAQAGWGRSFTWPYAGFFNGGDLATQFDSWYTIALLVLVFAVRKHLPLSFNVLLWISILLPLFSGSVASMPRFTTVLFPLFLLAGEWLAKARWRYWVLAASFAVQLFWFNLWLNGALIAC